MPILSIGFGWRMAGDRIDAPKHCLPLPFVYTGKFFLAYAYSVFFVYLLVPGLDILFGFKNICCRVSFKKDKVAAENYAEMPARKLFEQIGEAVPQFSIAVTFYALNWHWLSYWDKKMGVVTMTLSAGSILMGLVKGGKIVLSKGGLMSLLTTGNVNKMIK